MQPAKGVEAFAAGLADVYLGKGSKHFGWFQSQNRYRK
jgi:hypothetical protein